MPDGGILPLQRLFHVVADEAAEGGEKFRQAARLNGNVRLPEQKRPQQLAQAGGIFQRQPLLDQGAVAVQRPLATVGVYQVGQIPEALPLLPVVALVAPRVRALAGRLEFDIAAEQAADGHADVGADAQVGGPHLGGGPYLQLAVGPGGAQQVNHGRLQLIFGVGLDARAPAFLQHPGQAPQGRVPIGAGVHRGNSRTAGGPSRTGLQCRDCVRRAMPPPCRGRRQPERSVAAVMMGNR